MDQYIWDGRKMTGPEAAMGHLTQVLGSPEPIRDPDGLWDWLCRLPVPFHISVTHWDKAARALEDYADEVLEVLCDLVEEEPEFTFDMSD